MNSFVVGLIISFVSTFKRLVISWSIKQFGTNCRFLQMGRIVAFSKWDELTLGTNCRFLEFGTNCRLGRIVAWDELSLGTNCRPTTFWNESFFPGMFWCLQRVVAFLVSLIIWAQLDYEKAQKVPSFALFSTTKLSKFDVLCELFIKRRPEHILKTKL